MTRRRRRRGNKNAPNVRQHVGGENSASLPHSNYGNDTAKPIELSTHNAGASRAETAQTRNDDPNDCKSPAPLALAGHCRKTLFPNETLVRYAGDFWQYRDGCYYRVSDEKLRVDISHAIGGWHYFDRNGNYCPMSGKLNSSLVHNVIQLLPTPRTLLPDDVEMPCWLDEREREPATDFVNTRNGLVHVPTRTLHPHSREYFSGTQLPFDYNPKADSPEVWIERFLMKSLPGDAGITATQCVQEFIGYCLTNDTQYQSILCLNGASRSGKGTLIRALVELVGRENVCSPTIEQLSNDFGLSAFVGKRIATFSDAVFTQKQSALVTSRLLSISGNDALDINRKHKPILTGHRLDTKIVIAGNEVPKLRDPAGALANRLLFIDFPVSFAGQEDRNLDADIQKELPGLFNWALDGYARLREQGGFTKTESKARQAFRQETDPIAQFVEERCTLNDTLKVRTETLFKQFCHWCDTNELDYPRDAGWFGRMLQAGGRCIERVRASTSDERGKRPMLYSGIALNPS